MKKHIFAFLSTPLCFLVFVLAGCAIARLGNEQITNEQIKAFHCAKTVRIVIKQSCNPEVAGGGEEKVRRLFEKAARKAVEYAGLKVVASEVKDYDLSFRIESRVSPLSADYERGTGGVLYSRSYSGARLSGLVSLEIQGIPPCQISFKGVVEPPRFLGSTMVSFYNTPSRAPFESAYLASSFRSNLVEMMGKVYGDDWLLAAMNDDYGPFNREALEALAKKEPMSIEHLVAALQIKDVTVRMKAAQELGNIADPRAVEPLISALIKVRKGYVMTDRFVRAAAAEALGNIADPRAVEPLISALQDKSGLVRLNAASALGEINDPRAVQPLIASLRDKDVKINAAKALGKTKDSRAVQPLIGAMHGESEPRQKIIAEVLKSITGKDFGANQERWLKWWDQNKETFPKGR